MGKGKTRKGRTRRVYGSMFDGVNHDGGQETSIPATTPEDDSQRAENKPGGRKRKVPAWVEEQRKRFGLDTPEPPSGNQERK